MPQASADVGPPPRRLEVLPFWRAWCAQLRQLFLQLFLPTFGARGQRQAGSSNLGPPRWRSGRGSRQVSMPTTVARRTSTSSAFHPCPSAAAASMDDRTAS